MNLLNFKNRFSDVTTDDIFIGNVGGYSLALSDLLEYLKSKTDFNPEKRMIDACELLDTISETNDIIMGITRQLHGDLLIEKARYGNENDEKDDLPDIFSINP